jgi:hypothetical protein
MRDPSEEDAYDAGGAETPGDGGQAASPGAQSKSPRSGRLGGRPPESDSEEEIPESQ